MEELWRDPEWLASALSWVDQKLSETGRPRTGEPDQVHVRPWSTVIKVPTARSDVVQDEHRGAQARGSGGAAAGAAGARPGAAADRS